MPTAAVTKKHVPRVSSKYSQEARLPMLRNPSISDIPVAEA